LTSLVVRLTIDRGDHSEVREAYFNLRDPQEEGQHR